MVLLNLDGLMYLIIAVMIGPPLLLSILAFILWKKNKTTAIVFLIIAVLYLLVGWGICFGGF